MQCVAKVSIDIVSISHVLWANPIFHVYALYTGTHLTSTYRVNYSMHLARSLALIFLLGGAIINHPLIDTPPHYDKPVPPPNQRSAEQLSCLQALLNNWDYDVACQKLIEHARPTGIVHRGGGAISWR